MVHILFFLPFLFILSYLSKWVSLILVLESSTWTITFDKKAKKKEYIGDEQVA